MECYSTLEGNDGGERRMGTPDGNAGGECWRGTPEGTPDGNAQRERRKVKGKGMGKGSCVGERQMGSAGGEWGWQAGDKSEGDEEVNVGG